MGWVKLGGGGWTPNEEAGFTKQTKQYTFKLLFMFKAFRGFILGKNIFFFNVQLHSKQLLKLGPN